MRHETQNLSGNFIGDHIFSTSHRLSRQYIYLNHLKLITYFSSLNQDTKPETFYDKFM